MAVEGVAVETGGPVAGVAWAQGFTGHAAAADIRGSGDSDRLDVALVVSDRAAAAAGVFTRNTVRAAPVLLSEARVAAGGVIRGVVINSGNANACTGEQGVRDAEAMAAAAAHACGAGADEFLVCSTGVIGRHLAVERVRAGITNAAGDISEGDLRVARAIMTTDTVPKRACAEFRIDGVVHRVGGMAKGAGMIHPDMATLIVVVTTDAAVAATDLQTALHYAVDDTFNCVTVDGDTSTNDTALLLANGAAGGAPVGPGTDGWNVFTDALNAVCTSLAEQVVADAEGATRYFRVAVTGAASTSAARTLARTVAASPLVKTAIHGGDPNWGRIVAAAGRAGVGFDAAHATVSIAGMPVFANGAPVAVDLEEIATAFRAASVDIDIALAAGSASGRAWGCDLSADYVHINADYTT